MTRTNHSFIYQGYHLAYHQAGTGSPIIMLHNGGCSHIIWKHQIEYFSRSNSVFALDLLGFGDSDRPGIPYTLDLYVDILARFISEKNLVRPVLMGNCIGAAISLEYARMHPEKSGPLILCNVCGGVSMMRYFHPYLFPNKTRAFSEKQYRWMFAFGGLDVVQRKILQRLYGSGNFVKDDIYHQLRQGLKHSLQPQSRIMLMQGLPSFNKFDRYEEENPVPLPPSIVFWGQNNRVLPVERGKHLIRQLKPDIHKIWPGLGHLLMAEAPDEFNQEAEDFLLRVQEKSIPFSE